MTRPWLRANVYPQVSETMRRGIVESTSVHPATRVAVETHESVLRERTSRLCDERGAQGLEVFYV